MPIKAENRARYPHDWKDIVTRIRARGGNCCEGSPAYPDCRAANGEPHPVTGSRVVLTVGHLDHMPEHNDPANLKLWCQRCHNTYDAPFRAANRKAAAQTNYAALLRRQAKVQRLAGLPMPTVRQAQLALRAKLGELAHAVNADWAWWPSDTPPDPARVLAEGADVLQFCLLLDLAHDGDAADNPDWGDLGVSAYWLASDTVIELLSTLYEDLNDPECAGIPGWVMTDTLCELLGRYGHTPADLAAAYYAKTEVNPRHWATVRALLGAAS